jgi:DNA-binding transcriptional MerR regulator
VAEYRVDELASASGATVRSIRVYQDRGLLPSPVLRGRVGWYDESHLARLRLIARLQERGHTLATIAELLTAWESGRELSEVLGVEEAANRPWVSTQMQHISAAAMVEAFGGIDSIDNVTRAIELGILVPEGDGFAVPSLSVISVGAILKRVGVPVPEILTLTSELIADMERVARRLVDTVGPYMTAGAHEADGLPTGERLREIRGLLEELQPTALEAVGAWLSRAMNETTGSYLAQLLGAAHGTQHVPAAPDDETDAG